MLKQVWQGKAMALKNLAPNFQSDATPRATAPSIPRGAKLSQVGQAVRRLRRQRQLTLQALASQAEISVGMLSQIERGVASPSLRSLLRVAEALEVPVGWLFDPPRSPSEGPTWVLRRPQRRSIALEEEGITKELLSPPGDGTMELLLVTVRPGGSSGPAYTHAGEDAGVVLEGSLLLEVDGEPAVLEAGDAFRFASSRPHRFCNRGTVRTVVLWALTPPFY
jgi:transcriptional regulator with XRE-family HTH domain